MVLEKINSFFISVLLSITVVSSQNRKSPCDNFTLVTREEWRARPFIPLRPLYMPLNQVIIAHTATSAANCKNLVACCRTVEAIQTFHMEDYFWIDIAYNFLIGADGRVYEGVGWITPGIHTLGFNRNAIGIGFIGNYMEVAPSDDMLLAAQNLLACGVEQGYLTPTYELSGARDATCTASPGDLLYSIIRKWDHFRGGRISGYQC